MELRADYWKMGNGEVITEKLRLKGTEVELRSLALTVMDAIDRGKATCEVDGVPIKIKRVKEK
jgi:hypothetical protein